MALYSVLPMAALVWRSRIGCWGAVLICFYQRTEGIVSSNYSGLGEIGVTVGRSRAFWDAVETQQYLEFPQGRCVSTLRIVVLVS